jgi:cell division protein FtsL
MGHSPETDMAVVAVVLLLLEGLEQILLVEMVVLDRLLLFLAHQRLILVAAVVMENHQTRDRAVQEAAVLARQMGQHLEYLELQIQVVAVAVLTP